MNEYEVTLQDGLFSSKKVYVKAESAEEVQKEIEEKCAFEISEGLTYTIKKL